MRVLLTGGAGYLGSHVAVALIQSGHDVVLVDTFENSRSIVPLRIEQITGKPVISIQADIMDEDAMVSIMTSNQISAVGHFAGLKSIAESIQDPIRYHSVNVDGTLRVMRAMRRSGVKTFLFSSSAAVYGHPVRLPIDETHPLQPANPYGRSKHLAEQVLMDIAESDPEWRIACLRYFNPVGADASGLIGEDSQGAPSQLLPLITKVAAGELPELLILGGDFPTPDGTGIRDFLHVSDVASGYVKALSFLQSRTGFHAFNLGAEQGTSVLDLIRCFESVTGRRVPYSVVPRRPNDVPAYYADSTKAKAELGWSASYTLSEMCHSAWVWAKQASELAQILATKSLQEEPVHAEVV